MSSTRTDKDVGDAALAGFLLEVILKLSTVLPVVEPTQRHQLIPAETNDNTTDSKMTGSTPEYSVARSVLALLQYGHQLLENTTTVFPAMAFCSDIKRVRLCVIWR